MSDSNNNNDNEYQSFQRYNGDEPILCYGDTDSIDIRTFKVGSFIVLEGIDGCGKSTQVARLASLIFGMNKDYDVHVTREPTVKGRMIRDKMRRCSNIRKDAEWYTESFIKDRAEHINEVISPNLNMGSHVICDRFKYSTFAYQHALGVSIEKIRAMHKDKCNECTPDLVIIIDCPVKVAQERIKERKSDKFDGNLRLQEKVRENYLKMKNLFPNERIKIVDGNRPLEEVSEEVEKLVSKTLLVNIDKDAKNIEKLVSKIPF